jgi:integrase
MKKLTAVKIQKTKYKPIKSKGPKNPGKLLDNRIPDPEFPGLYLNVTPHESKSFRFDFRFPPGTKGKRQCLTYGQYQTISQAEAREMHLSAKRDLAAGINPAAKKQQQKRKIITDSENIYETVSKLWFDAAKAGKPTGPKRKKKNQSRPKSRSWIESAERWLEVTRKVIGHKPMNAITKDDVLAAVRSFEADGHGFSAERARQQISQVFVYAIWKGIHNGINPAVEADGEIAVPEHKGHAHIKEHEIPEFVAAVDGSKADPQTKRAAKLLLLTLVRKAELLGAKPSEIDLNGGIWEIPPEQNRVKSGLPHLVPLSRQVKELFQEQLASVKNGGDYVFPNLARPGKHAGLSTLNRFFDRIGFRDRLTPHGLRTVASTKLNGTRRFAGDVIELQLSHREKNKVRAVYNKSDHLEERAAMVQWWADFIDGLCAAKAGQNIVPLQKAA